MKKLVLSVGLFTMLTAASFAESEKRKDERNVSPASYKFQREFKDVDNAQWDLSSGYFQKVTFVQGGVQKTVFYDKMNNFVATTQAVEFVDLPAMAVKNLIKEYYGYEVGSIIKYDDGHTVYFINLRNEESNFLVRIEPDAQVRFFKKLI